MIMTRVIDYLSPFCIFKESINSYCFADKSNIINEFNKRINKANRYVCINLPRRFGKTRLAFMLASYYSKAFDSKEIFDNLKVSKGKSSNPDEKQLEIMLYKENLCKFHVIYLNLSNYYGHKTVNNYINRISSDIKEDIIKVFPNFKADEILKNDLIDDLMMLNEKFVFIIDEWDYIFNKNLFTPKEREYFIDFLSSLLKDKEYVAFCFMTGVIPIAQQFLDSTLNFFMEYTMIDDKNYYEYFGYTENEVRKFCKDNKYEDNKYVKYEDLKDWYGGYRNNTSEIIFNPWSVILALSNNKYNKNNWTSTSLLYKLNSFIRNNKESIKDDYSKLISGECISIKLDRSGEDILNKTVEENSKKYPLSVENIKKNKKKIYSAMVMLGILSYYKGKIFIPNKEIMEVFPKIILI